MRSLLAEAWLLRAAQDLDNPQLDSARRKELPPAVLALIGKAEAELKICLALRTRLQDPNRAETQRVLANLHRGVLTEYPLKPARHKVRRTSDRSKEGVRTKSSRPEISVESQPDRKDSAMQLSPAAIRTLVKEALTDQQFQDLCFDHFREVFDQFTDGQSRDARIRWLVEYAQKQLLLGKLLTEVRRINPRLFDKLVTEQIPSAPASQQLWGEMEP
jgi:hypothetical protein